MTAYSYTSYTFIYDDPVISFPLINARPKKRTPPFVGFFRAFSLCPHSTRSSWIGPQPEHERSHIGCASAHGHARAIERPHIALDVDHAPIAPDEDDLRQAGTAVAGRRARCATHVDPRRNEYHVSELRTFPRGRVRRGRTKRGGSNDLVSILGLFLLCAEQKSYDAWNARRGHKKRQQRRAW